MGVQEAPRSLEDDQPEKMMGGETRVGAGEEIQRSQGDQSKGGVGEKHSSRSLDGGETRVGVGEDIPRSQGDQTAKVGVKRMKRNEVGEQFSPRSLCSKGELQIVGVEEAPRSQEGDQPEKMMGGETRLGVGEEIPRSQGDQSKGGVGEQLSSRSLDGGETRVGVDEEILRSQGD